MTARCIASLGESPALLGELGGDCLCGRGPTVGTCTWTSGRLWFRAFHDGPAAFHLEGTADWACVDCVADATVAVATGQVREAMRNITRQRAGLLEAPDA